MLNPQKPSLNNQHVHNWLMEVPTFQDDYVNESQSLTFTEQRKERPLSISSEDSINLDELINANFTTCMVDETDLTNLASIDLDDSNEEFWKLDNVFHHYVSPTSKKNTYEQDHLLNTINLSKLSIYDNDYPKRYDRSGSLSSENSSTSTVNSQHYHRPPQPVSSTSTSSSIYSSKSSLLFPRPYNTTSSLLKKPSISKSETSNTSRRATHIPAPIGAIMASGPTPQKTKSTAPILQKKSSTGSLSSRSSSRIASHIPAPPIRSTTSLGISSVYTSPPPTRSSTSMSKNSPVLLKSSLRTQSLIRSPTSTKSTGLLKMSRSPSKYVK